VSRKLSTVNPQWWDYAALDPEILKGAARITVKEIEQLQRPGFRVTIFDSIEEFFVAEAMEYIWIRQDSTADNPKGICGPIGPTEQLPLVARIVNDMEMH
jgi:glucosamine-6-phosphate deaminase